MKATIVRIPLLLTDNLRRMTKVIFDCIKSTNYYGPWKKTSLKMYRKSLQQISTRHRQQCKKILLKLYILCNLCYYAVKHKTQVQKKKIFLETSIYRVINQEMNYPT